MSLFYYAGYENLYVNHFTGPLNGLPLGPQGLEGPTGAGGALGYYGSFYDTTIQANTGGGNTGIAMTFNTTAEANGISIVDNSKISFQHGGVYNIQFSAQFDKTDSGTDEVNVWLRQNGVDVPFTDTRLTSYNNNDKFVAAWNFMQSFSAGDYAQLIWASADLSMRIYAEAASSGPPYSPGIPSIILTAQQVMYTQIGPTGSIGATGPSPQIGGASSQIIFNQSGAYTGSNDLYYSSPSLFVNYLTGSSGSFNNIILNNNRIRLGTSAGQTNQGNNSVSIGPASGFSNQNIDNVAIGNSAGNTNQGTGAGSGKSVAIGYLAGSTTQGYSSIAIGQEASRLNQGDFGVSIGTSCGYSSQGTRSVAIGQGCGYSSQGSYSVAIGDSAGQTSQATESIAIGRSSSYQSQYADSISIGAYSGYSNQGTGSSTLGRSVAIGNHAGELFQRNQSVAIGDYAGNVSQGQYAIAIGTNAGSSNQASSSIILNASGNTLNATGSGLFIDPMSNKTGPNVVFYNSATKELSYSNQQFYISPSYVTAGLINNQSITGADSVIAFTGVAGNTSWWNNSTHRFIPTTSGTYVIQYTSLWQPGTGASNQMNSQIRKNGNTIVITQFPVNYYVPFTQTNSAITTLNGSTDYVEVTAYSSSNTGQVITGSASYQETIFNAYLLK